MRRYLVNASLVLCVLGAATGNVSAYTHLGTDWQAEYPAACAELQEAATFAQNCVLCHTSGFGLNGYGSDLNEASMNFAAIEGDDSDSDGRTNLQEILDDCTNPGDELSVPAGRDSWAAVKALYH